MAIKKDIKPVFNESYSEDEESLQKCILELKEIGYSQMETVKGIMTELKLPLKDADKVVLNSKVWENEKEATLRLRDSFEEGLLES